MFATLPHSASTGFGALVDPAPSAPTLAATRRRSLSPIVPFVDQIPHGTDVTLSRHEHGRRKCPGPISVQDIAGVFKEPDGDAVTCVAAIMIRMSSTSSGCDGYNGRMPPNSPVVWCTVVDRMAGLGGRSFRRYASSNPLRRRA